MPFLSKADFFYFILVVVRGCLENNRWFPGLMPKSTIISGVAIQFLIPVSKIPYIFFWVLRVDVKEW
jgi:hypothetical protein